MEFGLKVLFATTVECFCQQTRSFFFFLYFHVLVQMELNTSRTGFVNATERKKKTMALVYLYLDSVLMQCLTSVSIGGKRSSRTSPLTSSDMTIKRQWRSESESGEFLLVSVTFGSFKLHSKTFLHLRMLHRLC